MKNAVSLKGTKEGYQLIIQSSASLQEVFDDLKSLTVQLKKDSHAEREWIFKSGQGDGN
ncbi:MAG: hypothetical protein U5K84_00320 [Alkalibacterium sp.]|nr:hypothetical protein [Alkalibacterium sp.]